MGMQYNKLRKLLNEGKPSISTRIWSTWPFFTESVGATGNFDYIEYLAECSPFTQADLENIARAAEIHEMGSMIKVDFFNRAYISQKAVGAGFQSIMFTDHRNAEQVRESVRMVKPETPEDKGLFGFPGRRFIGTQPRMSQMDHAARLRDVVLCFMVEKASATEEIEEICSTAGVDMIQFGPSDYCMSNGWNRSEYAESAREAEEHCIKVALSCGVQPRCEIQTVEAAERYIELGVRHFSFGDQFAILNNFWVKSGKQIGEIISSL